MKNMQIAKARRITAGLLSAAILFGSAASCFAEPNTSGVAPSFDEAYYAITDYYGNLEQGSVVKSYILNGADSITDFGQYDEVINLSDGSAPESDGDSVSFKFGEKSPTHFYFEGKTSRPFETLPWNISIQYKLNGVLTDAEDLAGKTGLVEILIDAIPNEAASDYQRCNYVLTAAAIFNQNDILSLEAPGAQNQLVGNLRTVLFVAVPGEEAHFVIRVGTEDFSFSGMSFLLMPATLGQLEQLAVLQERKDELVDDYHKLSGSLDVLLDAVGNLQGSLNESANGLDELNQARETISAGKDAIYDSADKTIADAENVAELLKPVSSDITKAKSFIDDSGDILGDMNKDLDELKDELTRLKKIVNNAQAERSTVETILGTLIGLKSDINKLSMAMNAAKSTPLNTVDPIFEGMSSSELQSALSQAQSLHSAYVSYGSPGSFTDFVTGVLMGAPYNLSAAAASEKAESLNKLYTLNDADPGLVSVIFAEADDINDQIDNINGTIRSVSTLLSASAAPTENILKSLSSLCDEMKKLSGLLNTANDSGKLIKDSADNFSDLIDSADELYELIDDYEDDLNQALDNAAKLSDSASGCAADIAGLLSEAEDLMKRSGQQLDKGTKDTLESLAKVLRETSRAVSTTGAVKSAKNNIGEIIEDTWNEHSGEIDNLLSLDVTAAIESLTSDKNPSPSSVQIVIRTKEIAKEAGAEDPAPNESAAKTTFFGRIAQMFKDLWNAFTGIFRR